MTTFAKPAVVIIQGAWQTIEHYEALISRLRNAGFIVEFPALPTTNNKVPPTATLADDVAAVRATITRLADAGHPILALMHSYGGTVSADAVAGLSWAERNKNTDTTAGGSGGGTGGVIHLIYMAAFILPAGGNMVDPFGGDKPPWVDEEPEKGIIWLQDPRERMFSDLSPSEAAKWIDKMVACPASVIRDRITHAPYADAGSVKGIPGTYLVCTLDPSLTTEIQEGIAKALGENARLEYIEAGHCPQLSVPDRLVEAVQSAWAVAREEVERTGA